MPKKLFVNSSYPVVKIPVIDNSLKLPKDFKYLRYIYGFKYGYQHFYCQFHMSNTHIYLPTHDLLTKKKVYYPDILSVEYIQYSDEDMQEMCRKIESFTQQ